MNRKSNTARNVLFLMFLVVGAGLVIVLGQMDPSDDRAPMILAGAGVVIALLLLAGVIMLLRSTRSGGDSTRFLHRSVTLIADGQADAVIRAAKTQRTPGEENVAYDLALALAYTHQGRGSTAETYVQGALDILHARGECASGRGGSWLCDLARIALFNARMNQGEFAAAAHALAAQADTMSDARFTYTLVAWGHFLAGDEVGARAALDYAPALHNAHRHLAPHYRLVLVYLRHRLLSDPFEADDILRAGLANWRDEARRNAHNAYGRRLAEVLTDLRPLVEQPGG